MKKQKLSELAKGKGVYAFLLVGVFVVVTAVLISVNNQSGKQQENNNLVDLDDDPLDVAQGSDFGLSVGPDVDEVDNHANKTNIDGSIVDYPQIEKPSTLPGNKVADTNDTTTKEVAAVDKTTGQKELSNAPNIVEESKPVINTTLESLNFNPEDGLAWPLEGNIIMNYSDDRTIYHETLKQFKVNPAIMIQGEVGAEVLSATKGIVSQVENRPDTGITITMDIGDGYKLVYGQLQETELKVGDVIAEGEVIGTLEKVSRYYAVEGDNLYFQVLNADTTVNPMALLRGE